MKYKRIFVIVLFLLLLSASVSEAQFIVRVVFFQPTDVPDKTAEIRETMKDVHQFFGDEIFRRHHVFKTFRLEADATGQIAVHVVKGKRNTAYYRAANMTRDRVLPELPEQFKNQNNSNIIFVGGLQRVDHGLGGILLGFAVWNFGGRIGGYALLPANHINFNAVVHEVAHTFGIEHNLSTKEDFVMNSVLGHAGFDIHETRWLLRSKYFSDDPKPINAIPKIIKVHPIKVIGENMRTLQVSVDVSSPFGIWQTEISRGGILDSDLSKKETATFEFNVHLLQGETQVFVRVKDMEGNYDRERINLDIPPAAFMDVPKEPTTWNKLTDKLANPPNKPIGKPTDQNEEKSENMETEQVNETPHNVKPSRKLLILWANIKRLL